MTLRLRPGSPGWSRGQNLVEFPIVWLYWAFIMLGIASLSLTIYAYSFVSKASRDGARYAMVRGNDVGTVLNSDISTYVKGLAHGLTTSNITVTTQTSSDGSTWAAWPSSSCTASTCGDKSGNYVKVTVAYSMQPLWPFSNVTLPLTSSSQIVITY